MTARPCVAVVAEAESQPAAPLSPEETKTVMPSAAACCHRLLRKLFPEEPSACFAQAEAGAHHGRKVVVDDVLRRQVHAVARIRGLRHDELDGGAFGHGARPLHVEIGFGFFIRTPDARVGSVDDDLGVVGGKAEGCSELARVRDVDVGTGDDGYGLAVAVDRLLVERIEVVDGGEVCRGQVVRAAAAEVRGWLADRAVHWFAVKVVQRDHASHDLNQGRGNFRIVHVGVMDFIANLVGMNRRMECGLHLRGGAAENDGAAAGGDLFHLHAMPCSQLDNLGSVGVGDAEALAVLLGREPLMVVRRLGVVLRVDKLIQGVLLRRSQAAA